MTDFANAEELARVCVKVGVGRLSKIESNGYQFDKITNLTAEQFCCDPRVMVAMMKLLLNGERLLNIIHNATVFVFTGLLPPSDRIKVYNESLERAVIEAAARALTAGVSHPETCEAHGVWPCEVCEIPPTVEDTDT